MSEQHAAMSSRPIWDGPRDEFYVECICGTKSWGVTADDATDEHKVHIEDMR